MCAAQVVQARKKKKKKPAIQVDFMALDKQAYEKRKQRESVGSPAATPPPGALVHGQPAINLGTVPQDSVMGMVTGTSNTATKSSSRLLSPSRDRPAAFGTSTVSVPEVRHPVPSPLRPRPILEKTSEVATRAGQDAADVMHKKPENVGRPRFDETTKTLLNSTSPTPMAVATDGDHSAIASGSSTSAKRDNVSISRNDCPQPRVNCKYALPKVEGAPKHSPVVMDSVPPGAPTPFAADLDDTDTSVGIGSVEGVVSGDVGMSPVLCSSRMFADEVYSEVNSISTSPLLTAESAQTNRIVSLLKQSQETELVRTEQRSDPVMNIPRRLDAVSSSTAKYI